MGEKWRANVHYGPPGTKVEYQGILYELVQAHTSQMGWEPSMVPALWRVCRDQSGVGRRRRNSSCSTCSGHSHRRRHSDCSTCSYSSTYSDHSDHRPSKNNNKKPESSSSTDNKQQNQTQNQQQNQTQNQEQNQQQNQQQNQNQQQDQNQQNQQNQNPSFPQPFQKQEFGQYGQQPPFGQPPFGQPPFGQVPFGQPYGFQPPFGDQPPQYNQFNQYGQPPYGYQQPPPFGQYFMNNVPYSWVPYTGGMPQNAVGIKNEKFKKMFYVGRGEPFTGVHPGYIDPEKERCYVSYNNMEVVCDRYEVLVCDPSKFRWIPCKNSGKIDGNPVIGGYEEDGSPLYVCKCTTDKGIIYFGKTSPKYNCAYYGLAGKEVSCYEYEVLTYV